MLMIMMRTLSSDDGLPEVYIRSHTWGHVIEGATIGFEISYYWATAPATAPTNVNVQLFQYGGDYISGSMSRVVTLTRGRGSKWLNVQTVDDQIDEPDGHIYAIIQSGTGYKVRDSSNFEFVSVKDNDADDNNDLPMLSISAFHPSDTGEGKSPYLDVFSDRVVTSDLRIRFEYTDLRGANIKNVRTFTRTMRANTSKLRIEPTIRRDNVYTNGGSFTVRILDSNDNSYRVAASPNDRVSRNFRDILSEIPIPIVISIQPLENEKREGESARFSIQSDWWVHGTAPIRLQISDTRGSNSPTITYRTVSISNSGQLTVNVTPQMDNVFTNGGSLTVSLDRVSTIPLEIASAPINSATVRIIDADADPSTLPTISISSSSSSITEGSTANFSIESSAIVSSPTNVKLRVYKYRDDAGVTNFIGSSTGELHTVALSQTSRTTTFSVATDNNDLDEANYKIKVELSNPESGDNYQVASAPGNTSIVEVQDDEPLPKFGIAGATAAALEPDSARFRLWTTTASASLVTVRINVSQTGNVLSGSTGETTTIMPAGERQTYLEIATENDDVAEDNGSITVTLLTDDNSPATYTLTSRTYRHSATVEVYDDDTTPTITIADAAPVVEGTDASVVFPLTTSHAVRDSRAINIEVTGATNFIYPDQSATRITYAVTLTNYSLRSRFQFPIDDDDFDEADGIISVAILAPTNPGDYQIGTSGSAQVSVSDNDESLLPTISISSANTTITEGSPVIFELTADSDPISDLNINFGTEISGDYFDTNSDTLSPTVNRVLTFASQSSTGSYTSSFTIQTIDDALDESDGYVTFTILAGTDYQVASAPNNSVKVNVVDDEPLPNFGIAGATAATLEPDLARFRLWTTTASALPVTVRINVSQTGNVLHSSAGDTTTIMPAGERQTYLEIATEE